MLQTKYGFRKSSPFVVTLVIRKTSWASSLLFVIRVQTILHYIFRNEIVVRKRAGKQKSPYYRITLLKASLTTLRNRLSPRLSLAKNIIFV